MKPDLKIGIVGLGTVGAGLIKLLQTHGGKVESRAGRKINIVAVHAKNKAKDRGVDLSAYEWVDDPLSLAHRPDIDVVVELVGGDEGIAKELVEKALSSKKHVVTANKSLLSKHGMALASAAEEAGVDLRYEAAVAGGIPIIKSIREGFAGNDISAVYGILNGTCNYILTEMRETGRDFADVLKEAQEKGYAEADPTFDVDGIDAAHKLSILCALAFGAQIAFDAIDVSGIRTITSKDIQFADELGYRIKLVGIGKSKGGVIEQSLEPCLVPVSSALGNVEGVFNAVCVEGDFIDRSMLEGRGAGAGPTASAVVADIIDIARGYSSPVLGVPAKDLKPSKPMPDKDIISEQYLHLVVRDQPGVIADITAILRDHAISIESMLQRGRDPGQPVSVVIMTHDCSRADIRAAAAKIGALGSIVAKPTILRVLPL